MVIILRDVVVHIVVHIVVLQLGVAIFSDRYSTDRSYRPFPLHDLDTSREIYLFQTLFDLAHAA